MYGRDQKMGRDDSGVGGVENRMWSSPFAEEEEPVCALYFVKMPQPPSDDRVESLRKEFEKQQLAVKELVERRKQKRSEKLFACQVSTQARNKMEEAVTKAVSNLHSGEPVNFMHFWFLWNRIKQKVPPNELPTTSTMPIGKVLQEIQQMTLELSGRGEKRYVPVQQWFQKELLRRVDKEQAAVPFEQWTELDLQRAWTRIMGDLEELCWDHECWRETFGDLKKEEEDLRRESMRVNEQYKAAVEAKERTYQKLVKAMQQQSMERKEYRENRAFARQVRELVAQGDVAGAQIMCGKQTENMMQRLNTDACFRADYCARWGAQRPNPMACFSDSVPCGEDSLSGELQDSKVGANVTGRAAGNGVGGRMSQGGASSLVCVRKNGPPNVKQFDLGSCDPATALVTTGGVTVRVRIAGNAKGDNCIGQKPQDCEEQQMGGKKSMRGDQELRAAQEIEKEADIGEVLSGTAGSCREVALGGQEVVDDMDTEGRGESSHPTNSDANLKADNTLSVPLHMALVCVILALVLSLFES